MSDRHLDLDSSCVLGSTGEARGGRKKVEMFRSVHTYSLAAYIATVRFSQLSHSIQGSYVPKREGPISVIPSHRTFRVLLTLV